MAERRRTKRSRRAPPKTWDEKCAALEAAFHKLPIRASEPGRIPAEHVIDGMARHLLMMVPYRLARPQPKEALHDLKKSTDRLLNALGGRQGHNAINFLPPAVLEALNYRPEALQKLHNELRILHVAAAHAKIETLRSGQAKPQEQKIAWEVAKFFNALTGEKPTVSVREKDGKPSPFLKLLRTVYKILLPGSKVSAENQGREVQTAWKIFKNDQRWFAAWSLLTPQWREMIADYCVRSDADVAAVALRSSPRFGV
jgi:hypothetical protein